MICLSLHITDQKHSYSGMDFCLPTDALFFDVYTFFNVVVQYSKRAFLYGMYAFFISKNA